MAIVSSDIQFWGCATMPNDDTTLNIGGAIDLLKKIIFTRLGGDSTLEMLSSEAADTTQTITIYYLDSVGALASEVQTLSGTGVVAFVETMRTFLKAVKSASTAGTVTIRKASAGATIATMEAAILQVRLPFYNQLSDPLIAKYYYERIFVKNAHATLALTSSQVSLPADTQGTLTFALDAALNGTNTNGGANNRQVAPSGYAFDAAAKAVANSGSLTAAAAQGIWLKSTLGAAKAPFDDTFTIRLSGITA